MPAGLRRPVKQRSRLVRRSGPPHTRVAFAHPSELEFARFLDHYRIRWAYEPVSFPLGWEAGKVTEMFAPDFYLPEQDLYVEITTMKQSLVGPKNRKVRRLRELFPDVKVRLVYRKDYEQLLAQAGYARTDLQHLRRDQIQQILVSPVELETRVRAMGRRISRDYRGRSIVLVGVLKGITFFLADLARQITVPMAIDYLSVARYSRPGALPGLEAGESDPPHETHAFRGDPGGRRRVTIQRDLDYPIEGRHVLLVEDVVNTGLTLDYILGVLWARAPATLEVVTLLDRPARRLAAVKLAYTGFQVPNDYVVGYGLDYRELYRNLPFICTLKPAVYSEEQRPAATSPAVEGEAPAGLWR